jgi:predicted ArsR family transcriptional regulator
MTTARRKILTYLDKSRTASAREISHALKMSAAAVRHHLRVLVSDGRLELAAMRVRERGGKGRPEKVYSLPRAMMGDNLASLSEALLAEAGQSVRVEVLAKRLAGEADFAAQPMAKRLNLTAELLSRMSYHAHWEAGPEGPRILFGHCPYAAILDRHPELCRMDDAMLRELTKQPARQIHRTGSEGSTVCVFAIGR